jgi:DNA-binding transcriptional MerR regulator
VIPQGRETLTEADIASASGMPLTTWRRREAEAFRARVKPVNPGERLRLYDEDQVRAYLAGRKLPRRPRGRTPHPDDLLTDREAAAVLGITAATVRSYASSGYLPPPVDRSGQRYWPRHQIEARRDADDQRGAHHGAGERAAEVAQQLAAAERGERGSVTARELQDRYGITERTAYRTLDTARALTP